MSCYELPESRDFTFQNCVLSCEMEIMIPALSTLQGYVFSADVS